MCSESREGCKVSSRLRAGRAGTRQGNVPRAELGRRRKNLWAGCRKGGRPYRGWAGLLLGAEHRGRGLTLCGSRWVLPAARQELKFPEQSGPSVSPSEDSLSHRGQSSRNTRQVGFLQPIALGGDPVTLPWFLSDSRASASEGPRVADWWG